MNTDDYQGLFDPEVAPELTRNAVSGIEPTEAEIARSVAKLELRLTEYAWHKLDDARIDKLKALMTAKAQAALQVALLTAQSELSSLSQRSLTFQSGSDLTLSVDLFRKKIHGEIENVAATGLVVNAISTAQHMKVSCYSKPLPFYRCGELLDIDPGEARPALRVIVVAPSPKSLRELDPTTLDEIDVVFLNATSPPILALNERLFERNALNISADTVEEYIEFFCMHVQGEAGPFAIVEHDRPPPGVDPALVAAARDLRTIGAVAQVAQPLTRIEPNVVDNVEIQRVLGTVVYADHVFRSLFNVRPGGQIEMSDDMPVQGVILGMANSVWRGPSRLADGTAVAALAVNASPGAT